MKNHSRLTSRGERKKKTQSERRTQQEGDERDGQDAGCAGEADRKRKRPQSLHEKLWVLVVCDNMKIVDVPEEGRRCFILRVAAPQRESKPESRKKARERNSRSGVCLGEEKYLQKKKNGIKQNITLAPDNHATLSTEK